MAKIAGNTVGVPNPQSDFHQNDATKADYIKNKPNMDLYGNALKGSASGASVLMDDVSTVEHKAEVKVSGVDNLENVTLLQCGLNLFNPLCITVRALQFEEEKPVLSRRSLKNDYGMRINSYVYDNEVGIVAIQEDTKMDNTTPVDNINAGFFYIYFDNPSPFYRFNQVYTLVADIEVLENKSTNGNMEMMFRGSTTPNSVITLTNDKQRILVRVTASQFQTYPNRRLIEVGTRGKSISMKNIMWLPGRWTEAPDYEDYKGTSYSVNADGTVDDVVLDHAYTRLIPDTDGAMVECQYNKDSNKVIEKLTNAIISLGGNV